MFGHPGKKLMFMGGEFGQWREWNCEESLDWHLLEEPMHAGLARWVRELNAIYQREPSLHQVDFDGAGFSWIDCNDNENSVISMIRRARSGGLHRHGGELHARAEARLSHRRSRWRLVPEVLNSDAESYGGSNMGNAGGVMTEPIAAHGYDQSLSLIVPPLGFLLLKEIRCRITALRLSAKIEKREAHKSATRGRPGLNMGVVIGPSWSLDVFCNR